MGMVIVINVVHNTTYTYHTYEKFCFIKLLNVTKGFQSFIKFLLLFQTLKSVNFSLFLKKRNAHTLTTRTIQGGF